MGKKVDEVIRKIEKSVGSKAGAIRVAKSKGLIKQKGKHLAAGPKMKKGRKKKS